MTDIFESESFVLPAQVRADVADRLKDTRGITSLELQLKGEALEGAKKFGDLLVALRRSGVKISHDVSIRLEFPRHISRQKALTLVESLPKPKNGTLRVRIQFQTDELKS